MSEKRQLPAFKNEDEEAQWWYDTREARGQEIAAAIREGRAGPSTLAEGVSASYASVRLDPEDVKVASELAKRRGMELHAYVRKIMHDALERESSLVAS